MYAEIKFESDRFRLLRFERRFDKAIRPGDDLACWVRAHLLAMGANVSGPRRAGEGWTLHIDWQDMSYLLGLQLVEKELVEAVRPVDHGEPGQWRLVLEKKRKVLDKLLWRNRMHCSERLCQQLYDLMRQQDNFLDLSLKSHFFAP